MKSQVRIKSLRDCTDNSTIIVASCCCSCCGRQKRYPSSSQSTSQHPLDDNYNDNNISVEVSDPHVRIQFQQHLQRQLQEHTVECSWTRHLSTTRLLHKYFHTERRTKRLVSDRRRPKATTTTTTTTSSTFTLLLLLSLCSDSVAHINRDLQDDVELTTNSASPTSSSFSNASSSPTPFGTSTNSTNNPSSSEQPSLKPTFASSLPSSLLSSSPTLTKYPTHLPTMMPTLSLRPSTSVRPTQSQKPSQSPSVPPSQTPSVSEEPSVSPSLSVEPTTSPQPSAKPTSRPSAHPSVGPSSTPSASPSYSPTTSPSTLPTPQPSPVPSAPPTLNQFTVTQRRIVIRVYGMYRKLETPANRAVFEQIINRHMLEYFEELGRELPDIAPIIMTHVDTILRQERLVPRPQTTTVASQSEAIPPDTTRQHTNHNQRQKRKHTSTSRKEPHTRQRELQNQNSTAKHPHGAKLRNLQDTVTNSELPTLSPASLTSSSAPSSMSPIDTDSPTSEPSVAATSLPTAAPAKLPSNNPTDLPTRVPTLVPTTPNPTVSPTITPDKSNWLELEYQQSITYGIIPDVDGIPNIEWTELNLFQWPIIYNERDLLLQLTMTFGQGDFVHLVGFEIGDAPPILTPLPEFQPTPAPSVVLLPTINTPIDNIGDKEDQRISRASVAIISSFAVITALVFVAGLLFYKFKREEEPEYSPRRNSGGSFFDDQHDETLQFDNTSDAMNNFHHRPLRNESFGNGDIPPLTPNGNNTVGQYQDGNTGRTIFSSSTQQAHNRRLPSRNHPHLPDLGRPPPSPLRVDHSRTQSAGQIGGGFSPRYNDIHRRAMSAVQSDLTAVSDKASFDDDTGGSAGGGQSSRSLASRAFDNSSSDLRESPVDLTSGEIVDIGTNPIRTIPLPPQANPTSPVHIPDHFDNEIAAFRRFRSNNQMANGPNDRATATHGANGRGSRNSPNTSSSGTDSVGRSSPSRRRLSSRSSADTLDYELDDDDTQDVMIHLNDDDIDGYGDDDGGQHQNSPSMSGFDLKIEHLE